MYYQTTTNNHNLKLSTMKNIINHPDRNLLQNYAKQLAKDSGIQVDSISSGYSAIKDASLRLNENQNFVAEAKAWAEGGYLATKTGVVYSYKNNKPEPGTAEYDLFVNHGE